MLVPEKTHFESGLLRTQAEMTYNLHDREFQTWVLRLHNQAESGGYESRLAQSELGVLYAQRVGVPRTSKRL